MLNLGSNGSGRQTADPDPAWAAERRAAMVDQQLRRRGIRDERVLRAMAEVPRHSFVSPEQMPRAYEDSPLAIGQGQTISQPYMVALMLQELRLTGTEKVLEVGTGSGYQAAVLALLAGKVITVEMDALLAQSARERLEALGFTDRATVVEGDGSLGYPPEAPYQGIVVPAAAPEVPQPLFEQLAEGGRMVIPVGDLDGQELRCVEKAGGGPQTRALGYCRFVPLTGSRGWQLE